MFSFVRIRREREKSLNFGKKHPGGKISPMLWVKYLITLATVKKEANAVGGWMLGKIKFSFEVLKFCGIILILKFICISNLQPNFNGFFPVSISFSTQAFQQPCRAHLRPTASANHFPDFQKHFFFFFNTSAMFCTICNWTSWQNPAELCNSLKAHLKIYSLLWCCPLIPKIIRLVQTVLH